MSLRPDEDFLSKPPKRFDSWDDRSGISAS